MADTRQDTVIDGLRKVYVQLGNVKLAPDANQMQNAKFLDGLMTAIQQFIIAAGQATIGAGAAPAGPVSGGMGGPPGMGGMASMAGGLPGQPPVGPGAPMGGGNMGLTVPPGNMDDLRRVLAGGVNG